MNELISAVARKTGITGDHIRNIIQMVEDGSTIPFIARYRKELTGGATDEQLRDFGAAYQYSRKMLARKQEIKRLIEERGHLDESVRSALDAADSLAVLEDIYRPYKEKKSTRAGLISKDVPQSFTQKSRRSFLLIPLVLMLQSAD